jgi:DNA-binding NarL/FixJ family response regulator
MVLSLPLCDDLQVAVTVLVVDDHPMFRASIRELLELEGFDVVGEAEDGASGIDLARRLDPDLVLLDVALPDMSGFDVAETLAHASTKVILTSSRQQSELGRRVRQSGALGFISKDSLSGESMRGLLEAA